MNSATAIIDARAPRKAIENLQKHFEVFLFQSQEITYDAISCHPDIFIFQGKSKLIIAPNAPQDIIKHLNYTKTAFEFGNSNVGKELENSTFFNCIETNNHLFHKQGFTDEKILSVAKKKLINLPQAYTRCSMIALNEKAFITSDKGIEKVLFNNGLDCLYINPYKILLPPYKHGFIGGCMGMWENKIFVIGDLNTIDNCAEVKNFIYHQNIEIVELYEGNLYDGGGIFFI